MRIPSVGAKLVDLEAFGRRHGALINTSQCWSAAVIQNRRKNHGMRFNMRDSRGPYGISQPHPIPPHSTSRLDLSLVAKSGQHRKRVKRPAAWPTPRANIAAETGTMSYRAKSLSETAGCLGSVSAKEESGDMHRIGAAAKALHSVATIRQMKIIPALGHTADMPRHCLQWHGSRGAVNDCQWAVIHGVHALDRS